MPHQVTDGQVGTNNVLVLAVPYQASAADSNSPEAQSIGSGPAFLYVNGQKVEGTWSRASRTDPFTLTDTNGAPIRLNAGRTFVELVDANSYTLQDS